MDFKNLPKVEQMTFIRHRNNNVLYFTILLICISVITALPFIKINVSVKTNGIIRPIKERTEVKMSATGIIKTINFKEGDFVQAGKLLLELTDQQILSRIKLSYNDQIRCSEYIHDLKILTNNQSLSLELLNKLKSSLYKDQLSRHLQQIKIHQSNINKAKSEWRTDSILFSEKVISRKEFDDKKLEFDNFFAGYMTFIKDQQSVWQQDIYKYSLQFEVTQSQQILNEEELKQKKIFAPISGIIQKTGTKYVGSVASSGETVCIISPEVDIQGECYIPVSDVGMLRLGQAVVFQVDAFNSNYFGTLTGTLLSIDNDFTLIDNKPVYKIKCSFNKTKLSLKNGFVGVLKKGLTFKARLLITKRSLWQLLFDSVENWILPNVS
ncbi:MAG: HlyD family efflux transporter periplasmic adaptor subunit [Sediminibacterium sp.]|nr:HlyD family efflux transporter periplasmic adaptor subunit [Sediminibacterium sp.]